MPCVTTRLTRRRLLYLLPTTHNKQVSHDSYSPSLSSLSLSFLSLSPSCTTHLSLSLSFYFLSFFPLSYFLLSSSHKKERRGFEKIKEQKKKKIYIYIYIYIYNKIYKEVKQNTPKFRGTIEIH
jgi:hypothetical protein